ncbi:hypothetical protein GBSOP10_104716 [Armatimonadetes bacterium GBS]|nr:MAG: hypothetical protein KatS3mg021_0412 [Fimbriimonadales bacterium]CUU06661.1 hypothetical protein GBSOP10_104716 [Armatimonadetes bacterium GBS]CUU38200.1 hypothetical protein GXSOP10_13665 [Armatimonadetes bacterium GXS]
MRENRWFRVCLLTALLATSVVLYAQNEECVTCNGDWIVDGPRGWDAQRPAAMGAASPRGIPQSISVQSKSQPSAAKYEWLKEVELFYAPTYASWETEMVNRLSRVWANRKEREKIVSEMISAGFVPTIAPVSGKAVLLWIPPSAIEGDYDLMTYRLALILMERQQNPNRLVEWQEIPEEAQTILRSLMESHLPYSSQRRQHVQENLDQTRVQIRYEIDFYDANGNIVGTYTPEVRVPFRKREEDAKPSERRFSSVLTQSCLILVSQPVSVDFLQRLQTQVYPAALEKVLNEYKLKYRQALMELVIPIQSLFVGWVGKEMPLGSLPEDWTRAVVDGLRPDTRVKLHASLKLCIQSPPMPGEPGETMTLCVPITGDGAP